MPRSRRPALPRRQCGGCAAGTDLGVCLRDVVDAIAREFNADAVSLWLRQSKDAVCRVYHDSGRLHPSEASAAFKDECRREEIPSLYSLAQTGSPLVLRDGSKNPMLQQAREWFSAGRVDTILAIPIPEPAADDAENAGWCLLFHEQSREYRSCEIDRAAMRGRHLSLAVQVARAAADVKNSAIAAERKRISRELHDTLAQGFAAILLQIENGKTLLEDNEEHALLAFDQARDLARESLAEARRAIWTIRPRVLGESDLPTALEALVRNMAAGSGVATKFTLRGPVPSLTVEIETNLLRIAQEAVTNALRHARARTIRVRLSFDGDFAKISVEDDGCGFSLADARSGNGFGLISMRERAENLAGKFLISSHPARGTRILTKIPIAKS